MKDLLIVEDDPTLGEGIRLALQAPELRPQLCRSLADAGELLSRRSFDLLILDINLPDGNGLDFLVQLLDSFVESRFVMFCFDPVERGSFEWSPISPEKGVFAILLHVL